jgi:hypothetical protein
MVEIYRLSACKRFNARIFLQHPRNAAIFSQQQQVTYIVTRFTAQPGFID